MASATDNSMQHNQLSLVIDMEHTIVHTSVRPQVVSWIATNKQRNPKQYKDFYVVRLPLNSQSIAIKTRPGLDEFLEKANKRYKLHMYTMAANDFVKAVLKVIDPSGHLFGDRIVSRNENRGSKKKSLDRFSDLDHSSAVILDDNCDVWDRSDLPKYLLILTCQSIF